MADIDDTDAAQSIKVIGSDLDGTEQTPVGSQNDSLKIGIQGQDGNHVADVELIGGKKKLLTDATVTVEQIFGFDGFADVWFEILTAGAISDTVRIQIVAGTHDSTSPDRDLPAVDVTTIVTASEAGDELALRDLIISDLNADSNFSQGWKASAIQDNPIVHITSIFVGEFGERLSSGDFVTTPTGTATTQDAFDNIKRRGKQNTGSRDPKDKRLVTVGISGEISSIPGAVGDLYLQHFRNAGSKEMAIDGSVTPLVFQVPLDTEKDIFIQELRLFGSDNGIKFGQFLGFFNPLTNGILIEIQSDEETFAGLDPIFTTDDIKHEWTFGGSWVLDVQAGRDDFLASFRFTTPVPLRKQGTFTTDDFVKVTIRDNISSIISFQGLIFGFKREI